MWNYHNNNKIIRIKIIKINSNSNMILKIIIIKFLWNWFKVNLTNNSNKKINNNNKNNIKKVHHNIKQKIKIYNR
jgi:hypothetical protein